MANSVTVQTLNDGPRNLIVKLTGILDTSDEPYTIKVNPANVSAMDPNLSNSKPTTFDLAMVQYSIQDGLSVNLYWDSTGTSGTLLLPLEGRGQQHYEQIGFIPNNASPASGSVALSTRGWSTGLILSYDLLLHLIKRR